MTQRNWVRELERRNERRRFEEQAQAGEVVSEAVVTVTGSGSLEINETVVFSVPYENPPQISWTPEMTSWTEGAYPAVNVGVVDWIRDEQGFYTGAKIYVSVTRMTNA